MKIAQITRYNTIISSQYKEKNSIQKNNIPEYTPSFSGGWKNAFIATMFMLPVSFAVTSCTDTKKDSQGIEYVTQTADLDKRANYVDTIVNPNHTVQQKETLYSISKMYGVTVEEIQSCNRMGKSTNIRPDQVLKIPPTITIKNVKSISDVSKATGLSKKYLEELEKIENPRGEKSIYYDNNGNPNIGAGHKLLKNEISKYEGREISDEEKYTLLTKDLLERENKIKAVIDQKVYDNLPKALRENVFDFVYHRGEQAFRDNKKLIEGLNNEDYAKAVANLYKNYTIARNSKGKLYEKHMSGLCKRSLIRMGNASTIFTDGIPEVVLQSARATYEEGLRLMKQEDNEGKFPHGSYSNVLAEYKDIVYNLFDGKIGEKTGASKATSVSFQVEEPQSPIVAVQTPSSTTKTPVYLNGVKLKMSKEQIEVDWANIAVRHKRPFKRPELVLDENGNITAMVKRIAPSGRGALNGKVIIVNQGHGGCAANMSSEKAKTNTGFDPGCSNAVMEPVRGANGRFKRDKNGALILNESNVFIGNGGKALEEWKVNELFSNSLIEKLSSAGATVYFVSGEVHHAQNAIRKIEKNNKISLFVSLHSNSEEVVKTAIGRDGKEYVSKRITKRGFYIMPNNRGGIDVEDKKLAQSIHNRFYEDSWLKGLGDVKPKSLGVLSSSSKATSPVPGVLIETGNLKHETDIANLNSRDFREKLIQATFDGIVDYLANK